MKILLVDDDPKFRTFTTIALEEAGIDFEVAEDGEQGLACLRKSPEGHFDLVLLDIEMPRTSGWELLHAIREEGNEIPVIFVTGREELADRVRGLRVGADDYIVKPVEYEELIARIHAVHRRRHALPVLRHGDLSIDLARRRVERAGHPIEFSPREFDLLLALVQAEGEPISRERLLREVWDMDFDPETNVIDVHIGRLRRKLNRYGPSIIETVRTKGYRVK